MKETYMIGDGLLANTQFKVPIHIENMAHK